MRCSRATIQRMAVCSACGETMIGSGKFCAFCGAPAPGFQRASGRVSIPTAPPAVTAARSSSPPARVSSPSAPPIAPFAAPLGSEHGSPSVALPPVTVQPFTNPSPPYAPFTAPHPVGAHVLVQWADGHHYPGIVQQIAPGQTLVVFPDGQHRWVDNPFLSVPR